MIRFLAVFLLATLVQAADVKPPSETSRLKLVNAFQHAVIKQVNFNKAQAELTEAVGAYNRLQETEASANGYPKGTTFTVNVDTQELTVNVPAEKKEEKK